MRLLRAAVFTAVCVALSAAAHAIVAGHAVGVWPLLAGWLAVFGAAAPLAGRERSLPGIAAGLAVGQLGLHLLFNIGEVCAKPAAARGTGLMELAGRLLCDDHGVRLTPETAARIVRNAGLDPSHVSNVPGMSGMSSHASADAMTSYSLSMVIGHLLAALAAGWLLRGGEAALWRLARLATRTATRTLRQAFALVRVLVAGAPGEPAPGPHQARFPEGRRLPRTVRLRHSVARRGPPAYALAA
jgi:hypothetical protein